MSVLPIVKWPDVRLSTMCSPVESIDGAIQDLIADMFDTMYDATGRGLAAPQVGRILRVFVIDVGWKEGDPTPIAMINPELTWTSDTNVIFEEGCLSIPGITTEIERPAAIELSWTSPEGHDVVRRMEGAEARCALHELDHLNGIVTFDRLSGASRDAAMTAYEVANG